MKSNNKLNKAFKDALDGHPEPLRDAQWERLRAELDEKRQKKPFPWIFVLAAVLMVGIAAGYFIGFRSNDSINGQISENKEFNSRNSSPENPLNEKMENEISQNPVQNVFDSLLGVNQSNQLDQHRSENSNARSNALNDRNTMVSDNRNDYENPLSSHNNSSNPFKTLSEPEKEISNSKDDVDSDYISDENESDQTDSGDDGRNPTVEPLLRNENEIGKRDSVKVSNDIAKLDDKDSIKKNKTKEENDPDDKGKGKFVLGLCSGVTMVSTKVVGFSNEENLHKETRSVFENAFERQQSRFFNFSFEWYFSKNIGLKLNTGLQYRSVNTNVDFDYKLKEAPFRDAEGKILTYITLPDSNAMTFRLQDKIGFKMVSLPIQLGYLVPITRKSEVMISGGITLSALLGTSGHTLSIDELSVKPVGEMLTRKFNVGYAGGLMYSYNIYKNWWLGLETQIQSSRMDYDMYYGVLKSRINVNSFNLNLRYKL